VNEFLTVLTAVLPVFALMVTGLWLRRRGWLSADADASLMRVTINLLLPTSEKAPQEWSYTFQKPADDWFKPGANLSSWKKGGGVFGFKEGKWGMAMNTEWHTPEIWMVRKLTLSAEKLKRPVLRALYARNATVYINGVKALELKRGYMMNYVDIPLSTEAAALLKAGENIIAIHAEKTPGEKPDNQFIDVGLGEETISW